MLGPFVFWVKKTSTLECWIDADPEALNICTLTKAKSTNLALEKKCWFPTGSSTGSSSK